jgi:hypothetical protein
VALVADESTVYWQEPKGGRASAFAGHTFLYSMPATAGGATSLLVDVAMPSWNGPVLLAIDDQRLYYLDGIIPSSNLLAMPKSGGSERQIVVPSAAPLWLDSSTMDDANIYWVGFDDQDTLRRTPKQGGQTEALWTGKTRPIRAVTVDACNVYWFASNPSELYYRAK